MWVKGEPHHVLLQLMRFDTQMRKLDAPVEFGATVHLPGVDYTYDLYAVIVHVGEDLESGHCVAYCRGEDGRCWLYNDARHRQLTSARGRAQPAGVPVVEQARLAEVSPRCTRQEARRLCHRVGARPQATLAECSDCVRGRQRQPRQQQRER